MKTEEQNRAIAEVMGWKMPDHPDVREATKGFTLADKWAMQPDGTLNFPHNIPDYCNDLNAMHDAEWSLTSEQHATFREKLRELQSLTAGVYEDYERAYVSAPPEDRAEAFLKALNLWEEPA